MLKIGSNDPRSVNTDLFAEVVMGDLLISERFSNTNDAVLEMELIFTNTGTSVIDLLEVSIGPSGGVPTIETFSFQDIGLGERVTPKILLRSGESMFVSISGVTPANTITAISAFGRSLEGEYGMVVNQLVSSALIAEHIITRPQKLWIIWQKDVASVVGGVTVECNFNTSDTTDIVSALELSNVMADQALFAMGFQLGSPQSIRVFTDNVIVGVKVSIFIVPDDFQVPNLEQGSMSTLISGEIAGPTVVAAGGFITPASLAGDEDDWNPTGFQDGGGTILVTYIFITASVAVDITGLLGPTPSTIRNVVNLVNLSIQDVTIVDTSGSSAAGNQFEIGADVILGEGHAVQLVYDPGRPNWVLSNGN